jgi:CSLREA domain-containing protein
MLMRWLEKWTARRPGPLKSAQARRRRTARRRPGLEALEDRAVPAVLTVNSPADDVDDLDGSLTLREAVQLANQNPDPDAITFDPAAFATAQTITLTDVRG